MKRTSIISTIKDNELQKLLDESNSIIEVLEKLGMSKYCGNHRPLLKRIEKSNLSTSILYENRNKSRNLHMKTLKINNTTPIENVFIKGSEKSSSDIRRVVLRNKLLPYVCNKCNNIGKWMGEEITLQIDHIDGDRKNNELSNLRFLCPNCHSQTDTFGSKNHKKLYYCTCGNKILKQSKYCVQCASKNISRPLKFEIGKEELEKLIWKDNLPYTTIGKMFGVSDNAVRKRCIRLGVKVRKNVGEGSRTP
jgi:5-methylcytosine-specific restriction endonuclease McrA